MISQEITLNGKKYRLTLTDQVLSDVRRLKALYNAAYEDPESFEEVSSAISDTINQIASAVEPQVSDSDLDALIQAVMKAVDEKSKETEEAKAKHAEERAKAEKVKSAPKTKKLKK
jgi:predicted neutral ceramidase superfamily lipid hydrolase